MNTIIFKRKKIEDEERTQKSMEEEERIEGHMKCQLKKGLGVGFEMSLGGAFLFDKIIMLINEN